MSQQFIGEIRLFPYNFAPKGWAFCMGQIVPTQQNYPLFSLIGSIYGGNGTTTFALPDMRGRALVGSGTGNGGTYVVGQESGVENVVLILPQMPSHNHLWTVTQDTGDTALPGGNYFAGSRSGGQPAAAYGAPGFPQSMAATTIGITGGTQSHNNMQPFTTLCYCIALTGIFPARN
ncbi:tail fiber protein [Sphingomonas sp. HF-S3]|uniref:Tail fiber protein n=1 Tax=Sphingomonas rustica TaxID=3103142 RepID=A0ABV0B9Q7_9SPHN